MSSDSKARGGCNGNQATPPQPELQTSSEMQAGVSDVSEFNVPQMDCPSEENLIRTAFASLGEAVTFEFDILNRRVRVYHPDMAQTVEKTMKSVGLGANLVSVEPIDPEAVRQAQEAARSDEARERRRTY